MYNINVKRVSHTKGVLTPHASALSIDQILSLIISNRFYIEMNEVWICYA